MKTFQIAQIILMVSLFKYTISLPTFLTASCVTQHCSSELSECMVDSKCRQAALWNAGCLTQSDPDSKFKKFLKTNSKK